MHLQRVICKKEQIMKIKKTKENKETKQFTISVKAIFSKPTYCLRQSINPYNTHLLKYIFP
jgi:hypothetical protein